jgi:hypothetical protein
MLILRYLAVVISKSLHPGAELLTLAFSLKTRSDLLGLASYNHEIAFIITRETVFLVISPHL